MSPPRIVDAVFDRGPFQGQGRRLLLALAAGLGLHAGTVLFAVASAPSLETWSAELAARVHAELTRQTVVELPPPPEEAKPPPPPQRPPERPPSPAVRAPAQRPPSPAQAGKIVAASPSVAVDLPGTDFVTGTATTYAGGVTSSSGRSKVAVTGPVDERGPRAAPCRSAAVSLDETDWNCPWPREADSQQIDEQSVLIQVQVRADGSAESARVLADPGQGFGATARACALATRFNAARDCAGHAIRAESPPIRVHFTR